MKMRDLIRKLQMAEQLMTHHEKDAPVYVLADYDQDVHDIKGISYVPEKSMWIIEAVGR